MYVSIKTSKSVSKDVTPEVEFFQPVFHYDCAQQQIDRCQLLPGKYHFQAAKRKIALPIHEVDSMKIFAVKTSHTNVTPNNQHYVQYT